MNRKRNVSYIKPEDPHFLKILKKEAGYDNTNHKFDKLENDEEDFVEDEDSEQPQIVVLKKGDLTAEEYDIEKERLKKEESESKADLNQKVVFKARSTANSAEKKASNQKSNKSSVKPQKNSNLLSFGVEDESDDDSDS
ncbi:uncharacterized protein KIAA1143 homolog [Danaus plexippus]|uniref:DUF4604 domain-containing protein n=1 Tax=Danaus plexippus plexippus TaxID=278856 RepID=A0A212EH81_DANPL|nr:uncharacterized protein KIAA1143 homolog [Danaus plexippus]OWR40847.1 hypothetical protein KGM_208566 [Danaus plexippus plexippus]